MKVLLFLLSLWALAASPDFRNVAKQAGLVQAFPNGGTTSKQYIIETTGSGIAFIDYDNDGLLDIFVLSGEGGTNRMYHNEGNGRFRDVTDALSRAKSHGATAICITHRSTSPITKVSDIVLVTAAKQTAFRSDASSSRIAQLAIIDTLYVGVANRNHERSLEMIQRTREATASKRY